MRRYKVNKPFVDFGIYNGVGDIISNASLINSLEVKIWEGTLTVLDDEGTVIVKPTEKVTKEVPTVVTSEVSPTKAAVVKTVKPASKK